MKHFREDIDGGNAVAMGALDYLKLHCKIVPNDHSGAHQLLKRLTKKLLSL